MEFKVSKENMKLGGIYVITSKINNRKYFGSTKHFRTRYNRHLDSMRNELCNILFLRYIKKYGIDSLVFEVQEVIPNYSTSKGKEVEQKYLNALFSQSKAKRFNILPEAYGTSGYPVKKKTKLKLSLSWKNGRKGHKIEESAKKLISEAIGRKYIQRSLDGQFIAEYSSPYEASCQTGVPIKKIKATAYGNRKPDVFIWEAVGEAKFSKKLYTNVCKYSKNGLLVEVFGSFGDAAKSVCGDASTIRFYAMKKKGRSCYQFYWRIFDKREKILEKLSKEEINAPNKIHSNSKRVAQINIKTREVLRVFVSPKAASDITSIPYNNIRKACSCKKYKNACGFRWEYVL